MKYSFLFSRAFLVASFAMLACNNTPNQQAPEDQHAVRDTVTVTGDERQHTVKKPQKAVDLSKTFGASSLGDFLTWEWFDIQKYLMAQGFDLMTGGKMNEYSWFEPDFGIPSQTRDSLVFRRPDENGILYLKILLEDHFNYTDEQMKDIHHYSGNPKEYTDPLNARFTKPAYSRREVVLYTDNRNAILLFINQFESIGCVFEKDVLAEIAQEQLEKMIPAYEKPKEISNTCECPSRANTTFNGASINFTTSFESSKPVYEISLSITEYH